MALSESHVMRNEAVQGRPGLLATNLKINASTSSSRSSHDYESNEDRAG